MSNFPDQNFDDGALIFSAGDVASHLYFIRSGTVEMLNSQGVVFAEVAQGQTFGEAAICRVASAAHQYGPREPSPAP